MVRVLQPGLYSCIQDTGRHDFQDYGVPLSGTMDAYSTKIANALVGNSEDDAVLEITISGPKLEFLTSTFISISGADISPSINNAKISLNTLIKVAKGDILSFGKLNYGCRCYLAVSGGFQTETVMNSRSMYQHITSNYRIVKGHVLSINERLNERTENVNASIKINQQHFSNTTIKVYKGPEFEGLTKLQQKALLYKSFSVAKENSRMAYQLNETLENDLAPIITSLVLPGTVQLTPSGTLVILMRDCQTTGGYPRVLQLSERSINRLAQKFTRDTVCFKCIS